MWRPGEPNSFTTKLIGKLLCVNLRQQGPHNFVFVCPNGSNLRQSSTKSRAKEFLKPQPPVYDACTGRVDRDCVCLS